MTTTERHDLPIGIDIDGDTNMMESNNQVTLKDGPLKPLSLYMKIVGRSKSRSSSLPQIQNEMSTDDQTSSSSPKRPVRDMTEDALLYRLNFV
jgi:hypothetical protein